jgi:hypothetical protein
MTMIDASLGLGVHDASKRHRYCIELKSPAKSQSLGGVLV